MNRKEAVEWIENFLQKTNPKDLCGRCPASPSDLFSCEACDLALPKLRKFWEEYDGFSRSTCCPCYFYLRLKGRMGCFEEVADFARRQMYGHGWGLKEDKQ